MPYTSEGRNTISSYYPSVNGSTLSTPFTAYSKNASQYGYRSAGEYDAAYAAETSATNRNWGDTISLIAAYDRIESAMDTPSSIRSGILPVHERTYTVTEIIAATPTVEIYTNTGAFWQSGQPQLSSNITGYPAFSLDSDIRAVGGNLLRESRPTKPHANLAQWFGELKQFGGMFEVPRELPSELHKYRNSTLDELRRFREGGRAVGSGYLAGQFGWLPFVGELINSLDSIANSGPVLDDFARQSSRLIRRSRSRNTFQGVDTLSGDFGGAGSATAGYNTSLSTGIGISGQNYFRRSLGTSALRFRYNTTVTRSDDFRASALYEYFVADPVGFMGTSKSYAQKAKLILGDPLMSLSTLWELTPWSWAIDWSFNLGGLLSFQESVAEDSLVAHRSSTVWERRVSIITHWEPYYNAPGYTVKTDGNLVSVLNFRQQRRLAGSPYDMGIDWSGFSSQKWFILGALGLAKAPGVKP
jgi:hypothetical protein